MEGGRELGGKDASMLLGLKGKQTSGRIRWLLWISVTVCMTINACACKLNFSCMFLVSILYFSS